MKRGLLSLLVLVALLAGSLNVSAQEPLTSTRITKDWGYEYTALTGDKIEVGDKSTIEFKPTLKLERWGGEAYIEVSLPTTEKLPATTSLDAVKWEGQETDVHFYPLEPTKQYELGGFEFEVILKETPLTNKITLNIETQELKFYYQPPLTEEFTSGWSEELQSDILVTETEVINTKTGNVLEHRPENVVGSYAVYHATKQDHILGQTNYGCGKAFHIYRPRIEDAGGKWVWGELYIDEKAGTITITIPQEFLNTATYPIRHATGATFGYTAAGASSSGFEDRVDGSAYTSGGAGTLTKMTAWLFGDGYVGKRKCAVYLASDLSTPIANGTTEERTDQLTAGKVEYDFTFGTPPNVAATTSYGLYLWGENVGVPTGSFARDADVGVLRWWESQVYNGWPALAASDRTGKFSIYATYAAGVVAPTVVTNAATLIEDTTATVSGNITATGSENCTDRGFQWDIDTGVPYADNWTEAGNFGVSQFTHGLTALPTGTTIYYRAGANNTAGWGWGGELTFLTKPAAPTNVAATDGAHTDRVVVTWVKSTGATGYKVYEGVNLLDTLGDVATYDDNAAPAGSITHSGNATASDGTSSVYVTLSLANEATANGASRTYKVKALNGTGDSDDSATDTGYRGVGAITYQWQMSDADADANYNTNIGTTDPYNATEAPVFPAARWFQCVVSSVDASNTPQTSTPDRGYRSEAPPPPIPGITGVTSVPPLQPASERMSLILAGCVLILFSELGFWRRNCLLFMLAGGASLMVGFQWYNVYTNNIGLAIGILLMVYALVCMGFAYRCIFRRERVREE